MSNKNIHYKLDFKIERPEGNITFQDFRRRYYWTGNNKWNVPFVDRFLDRLYADNKVSTLLPSNFNVVQVAIDSGIAVNKEEATDFHRYVAIGREAWYKDLQDETGRLKNRYITNSSRERYEAILMYLVTQTPEFQNCEAQFQTWLAKRPGLVEVWNEIYEEKPTLLSFAKSVKDHTFRTKLENARPRILKIGTLVQLKDKYVSHRNKDPFYYADESIKGSPRLGMISAFNEDNAYGYGSRLLKIMWIANSEESYLMERDLKILSE